LHRGRGADAARPPEPDLARTADHRALRNFHLCSEARREAPRRLDRRPTCRQAGRQTCMMSAPLSTGNRHLRASVLFAVAVESLFILFLTVFLFNNADPKGDGMEMVASSAAFMLIFLPLSLPAYLLAKNGR